MCEDSLCSTICMEGRYKTAKTLMSHPLWLDGGFSPLDDARGAEG